MVSLNAIPITPRRSTPRRQECSPASPITSCRDTQPGSEAEAQLSAVLQRAFGDIVRRLEDIRVQLDSLQGAAPSSTSAKDEHSNQGLNTGTRADAATAMGQRPRWSRKQRFSRSESSAEASHAEDAPEAPSHRVTKTGACDVEPDVAGLTRGSMSSRAYSDFVTKSRSCELRMVGITHSQAFGTSSQREIPRQSLSFWLQVLSQHWLFDLTVFVLILSSSVTIGLSVEAGARGMDIATLDSIEHFFSAFFTVELLIRVGAQGVKKYFCQRLGWNHFDAVIVLESLVSFCLSFAWSENHDVDFSDIRVMRSLKAAKLLRILRVVRVIHFAFVLRQLAESIAASVRLLMWTLVLLGIVVYVFATFFTGSVWLQDEAGVEPLRAYYGSIGDSSATLIQAISGGVSWRDATMPLRQASVAYEIAFLIYIAVSYIMIMNVMTGIMTAVALQASESDPELRALACAREQDRRVKIARELFQFLDVDNSGKLTLDELEQSWADHQLDGFLETLNIKSSDACFLFTLLDGNGDGLVDFEELCESIDKASQCNFSVELMRLQLGQRWIMKQMMRDTPSDNSATSLGH